MIVEELGDGICRFVARDQVGSAILRYVTDDVTQEEYCWTARQARDAADFWHAYSATQPRPAPILWADEEGLTFHRLPWKRAGEESATPLWDEILSRMSNAKAFALWVGSLFDARADLQQYVWLYGQGQNSKGAVMRFLEKAFGPAFMAQQPPSKDDKFWTYTLRDKRLVCFPDCNNTTFVTTGLFKSLTGGDAIRLEGKGKDATSARLSCKFLFSSNSRPALSSETADMRRAIFCELGAIPGPVDPQYEEKLWAEGGAFLRDCIEVYRAMCPAGGPLPLVDKEQLEEWVAVVEEELEVAFERAFELHERPPTTLVRDLPYVTPEEFQDVIQRNFDCQAKRKEFREWAERRHKIIRVRVKMSDGTLSWRYTGISLRPQRL